MKPTQGQDLGPEGQTAGGRADAKPVDDGVLVNDPSRSDLPVLNRHQVWQGLVMKAEDAKPFLPSMAYCEVIERTDNGLLREISGPGGGRVRERVTFFPEERVRFDQVSGPLSGWVENIIEEDDKGNLRLRFVFGGRQTPPPGAAPRGPGDPSAGQKPGVVKDIHRKAIESTLATVRRLAQEGKLK